MEKRAVSRYNPEIDLWKFLMALIIFIYHGNIIFRSEITPILGSGYSATEAFFIITGFLCATSTEKMHGDIGKNTLLFLKKKIQPIYLYILVTFPFAFYALQVQSHTKNIKQLCENLALSANELLLIEVSGADLCKMSNGPTWYISAMLMALAIIVPILLRFRNTFIYAVAPICALGIYAYISREFGTIDQYGTWQGVVEVGVLRAIAGISVGCFIYGLIALGKEKNLELTTTGSACLYIVQIFILMFMLFLMQFQKRLNKTARFDYVVVLCLVFLSLIIFSRLTKIDKFLPVKLCKFLGKFSLVLYLNHRAWTRYLNTTFPDIPSIQRYAMYIIGTVTFSFLTLFIVWLLRTIWKKIGPNVKNLLIKQPEKDLAL